MFSHRFIIEKRLLHELLNLPTSCLEVEEGREGMRPEEIDDVSREEMAAKEMSLPMPKIPINSRELLLTDPQGPCSTVLREEPRHLRIRFDMGF